MKKSIIMSFILYLNALDQNIIAFDIIATRATLKFKKIVFSNDLTSGTTWQNCNGATAKKK
jgi:hypothetical protein